MFVGNALLKFVVGFIGLLVFASAAQAQWYISGTAGATFHQSTDFTFGATPLAGNVGAEADLETGYAILPAIGHSFGMFRVEAEGGYRRNELDKVTITSLPAGLTLAGPNSVRTDGNVTMWSGMLNGFVDVPVTLLGLVKPYVGAGLGGTRVTIDGGSGSGLDDSATTFAFQGMAGLAFDVLPRITLSIGYRFFGTDNFTVRDNAGDKLRFDGARVHSAEVGVRFRL